MKTPQKTTFTAETAQALWKEYPGLTGLERAEFLEARGDDLAAAAAEVLDAAGIVLDHRHAAHKS